MPLPAAPADISETAGPNSTRASTDAANPNAETRAILVLSLTRRIPLIRFLTNRGTPYLPENNPVDAAG